VLAQCGYGSLRGLEELIIAGRITVNRQPAEVGQKVGPNDQVRINGELVRLRFAAPRVRVLLYHKPAGEIVSRADPEGRPTVFDKLPRLGSAKWIAVGRLDFNSEGLLIFTTLGELANRLMHPRYEVEREYSVRVMGTLTPEHEKQLLEGVELEDGPAKVLALADGGGEGANHWYKIVLPEGRNKEVRRMFEINFFGLSRMTRAVLPIMRRQRSGHIVNISSIGGLKSFPALAYYHATKFAVEGFSESLAIEVAPLGIKVTLVEPSGFRTDWAGRSASERKSTIADYADTAGRNVENLRDSSGKQPGDPVRAAAAIIAAVESPDPPLHLLLGKAALKGARGKLETLKHDFDAWEETTLGADFPDA